MHKVDQTVLDAIGIYDASCEAAGAPKDNNARLAAIVKALAANVTPEEIAARLTDVAAMSNIHRMLNEQPSEDKSDEPAPSRKPRASRKTGGK